MTLSPLATRLMVIVLLGMTGCDKEKDVRKIDLLVHDKPAGDQVFSRQRELLNALASGNSTEIADYVSTNVRFIGLNVLDTTSENRERGANRSENGNAGYFTLLNHRFPQGIPNTRVRIINTEIAGMPRGMNALFEINGHPVIAHWAMENGKWTVVVFQAYGQGRESDSLIHVLNDPRN